MMFQSLEGDEVHPDKFHMHGNARFKLIAIWENPV
jgi:hypothetical protein